VQPQPQPQPGPPVIDVPIPDIVRNPGSPDSVRVELPPNLGGVDITPPTVQPPQPQPQPQPQPPAIPIPVVQPVPDDTRELVTAMLAQEKLPRWKKREAAVRAWQVSRGMVDDGMFGPKSGLVVANEVGTVPIVRFWPRAAGANPRAALDDYRAALETIARNKSGVHAQQLRKAAARERGQGFGPPQGDNGIRPVLEGF